MRTDNSIDILYPIGYDEYMITIRETEQFKSWILNIKDNVTQAIINARIRRISTGNFGDSRSVGDGVFELRIHYGPGYRVYFKDTGKEIVILLCGGDKSTQSRDITAAKQIAQNVEEI
jgi:putative addiction module killer protein